MHIERGFEGERFLELEGEKPTDGTHTRLTALRRGVQWGRARLLLATFI